MQTALLIITVLSVIVAIASFIYATRLRRYERERSDARVVALAAAAEAHGTSDGGWKQVAGEWQWVAEPAGRPETPMAGSSSAERFFGTVEREEPTTTRWPIFAAAALLLMLGGSLVFLNSSTSTDEAAATVQPAHSEPLELVALGHARDVKTLTITGTVRNPMSGVKVEGLTAVISLLDRNGTLVSTKDVPLDYRALGPGEEAPFKVAVPDPGSISRYRVSFRSGTEIVPHVDRRSDTKLASALK